MSTLPPLVEAPARLLKKGAPVRAGGNFHAAMRAMEAAVGAEFVEVGEEDIRRRAQVIIPDARTPVAYVRPGTREEVQEVVRIAAKHGLSLWPCSTGKNWGYGATTATSDGAVILLLERMNRIVEVNEELAYAVIEPGVTYRQLNAHLKERGYKLWTDCTDGPQDASVLGNALDRGIGETDYGDHFGNLCGIEAVLPDGRVVRTGGGHPEKSKSRHLFKWGTGPYLEGLFTQANFGVVTRAGLWLRRKPEAFNSFVFELARAEDFGAAIETLRELELDGVINSKIHMINDFTALSVVLKRYPWDLLDGKPCIDAALMQKLRKKYNVAPWSLGGGIYGSREQVRAARAAIKRRLGRYGRLIFLTDRRAKAIGALAKRLQRWRKSKWLAGLSDAIANLVVRKPAELMEVLPQTHALLQGIPTDYFVRHAYFKARAAKPESDINPARDGCGLIWAGPVVPMTGRHLDEVLNMCRPLFEQHGFDFYVALMVANPRSVIALMSVFYDKANPEETARARSLYNAMCEITAAAGYQQYRTSTMYMDRILAPSGTFLDFANELKRAVDPQNVIAPGRYGIKA